MLHVRAESCFIVSACYGRRIAFDGMAHTARCHALLRHEAATMTYRYRASVTEAESWHTASRTILFSLVDIPRQFVYKSALRLSCLREGAITNETARSSLAMTLSYGWLTEHSHSAKQRAVSLLFASHSSVTSSVAYAVSRHPSPALLSPSCLSPSADMPIASRPRLLSLSLLT